MGPLGSPLAYRNEGQLDPRHAHHAAQCFSRGCALQAKSFIESAIAAFRESIWLEQKHARAHCCLGDALQTKGDFIGAIGAYQAAHRLLATEQAEMLINLGNALCANAQTEKAIETYREANRLDADAVPLPVRIKLMEAHRKKDES